jgi:hypothetical protein
LNVTSNVSASAPPTHVHFGVADPDRTKPVDFGGFPTNKEHEIADAFSNACGVARATLRRGKLVGHSIRVIVSQRLQRFSNRGGLPPDLVHFGALVNFAVTAKM